MDKVIFEAFETFDRKSKSEYRLGKNLGIKGLFLLNLTYGILLIEYLVIFSEKVDADLIYWKVFSWCLFINLFSSKLISSSLILANIKRVS
ncbi:hypothetical protein Lsan_3517 [Legionella santicrucis]|uniref:Uncharacterized protein n=1 Tax=Legionella santicrucis TaxID=45074 RepID=A0A0W0YA79_9GAMM|nr:hypothetical protein Lsan_3517 [Legionella santicrucis]